MILLLKSIRKDTLVHAGTIIRKVEMAFQPLHQIVGVEHSHLTGFSESLCPHRENIGIGFDENSEVPIKSSHFSDAVRPIIIELIGLSNLFNDGYRKIRGKFRPQTRGWSGSRPSPRTASSRAEL